MSKKKLKVDQYDPQIYPFKLYVVKNYTEADVKKLFNITPEELEGDDHRCATTIFGVQYKNNNECSCVVLLSSKTMKCRDLAENVDTCAHEALHFVIHTMECIGTECSSTTSEAYCYLLGWATKCIFRTLISK